MTVYLRELLNFQMAYDPNALLGSREDVVYGNLGFLLYFRYWPRKETLCIFVLHLRVGCKRLQFFSFQLPAALV